jgi:hypothetical protein
VIEGKEGGGWAESEEGEGTEVRGGAFGSGCRAGSTGEIKWNK